MSSETDEGEESYVDNEIKEFTDYFQKELQFLDQLGVEYITHDFLSLTIQRVKCSIVGRVHIMMEEDQRSKAERKEYLRRIHKIISKQALNFGARDGPFWEEVSERLDTLAASVKSEDIEGLSSE